jgi:predicted Zn-dependent protease
MTLQRVAVLIVAAVAIAWLGVSYGNAGKIRQAQVVAADRNATPARIEAALADVRSADALDPGTGAELLSYEASLEIQAHRLPDALKSLEELVRREPDTAEAWFLIAELTRASDPARSAAAQAELHRLDPLGAPAQP